jgi:primary-amine oxidase
MVVPYADTDPIWVFRNAFDVGEYRIGRLINSLDLGKEVPENAMLLDAVLLMMLESLMSRNRQ